MNITVERMKVLIGEGVCQISVLIAEKEAITQRYKELTADHEKLQETCKELEKRPELIDEC